MGEADVVDSVDEADVSVETVVVKDSEVEAVVDSVAEVSVEAVSVRAEEMVVSVSVDVATETVDVSLAELPEVVETSVDSVVEGRHGPALTPLAASRARVLARSRAETMITSERRGFEERQE